MEPNRRPVHVCSVDDHPLLREGISAIFVKRAVPQAKAPATVSDEHGS